MAGGQQVAGSSWESGRQRMRFHGNLLKQACRISQNIYRSGGDGGGQGDFIKGCIRPFAKPDHRRPILAELPRQQVTGWGQHSVTKERLRLRAFLLASNGSG